MGNRSGHGQTLLLLPVCSRQPLCVTILWYSTDYFRVVRSLAAAGAPAAAARSPQACSAGPRGEASPADGRTRPSVAQNHAGNKNR